MLLQLSSPVGQRGGRAARSRLAACSGRAFRPLDLGRSNNPSVLTSISPSGDNQLDTLNSAFRLSVACYRATKELRQIRRPTSPRLSRRIPEVESATTPRNP